jgi:hypothetical protein
MKCYDITSVIFFSYTGLSILSLCMEKGEWERVGVKCKRINYVTSMKTTFPKHY